MKPLIPSFLAVLAAGFVLGGCTAGSDVEIRSSSAQPRLATWRCTGGVTLTVASVAGGLMVTDSRGIETDLPPDPPGQRERYGKTGYALVFDGRTASWFASGKAPTDCKR